ncbi:thiamine pyrophosphate-requiring protein [Halobium palmae]|uniref:Thiamine pyrophosphate-requiring protein n=1 Tax=Halobium palmae TaxID=1776492 RepID=A0ABD5RWK2_9EURY
MGRSTSHDGDNESIDETLTVAERLLQSFAEGGVSYIFANFGTDHTPLLEAASRIREAGKEESIPKFVICPTEYPAMSIAHGYAAVTGEPQAVLVHVDVGTQNLGPAMHNAHRAKVPVFVVAGLAPISHQGHPGSRDINVHYLQDVFDQPGIVREYCRWTSEYRPPTDPAELVERGLERATAPEPGPVYLSATREALETSIEDVSTDHPLQSPRRVRSTGADADVVTALAERVTAAETPLLITGNIGTSPGADRSLEILVDFAEAAGAGIVENPANELNFPRDHDLHAGFTPAMVLEDADLLLLMATDVPWIPAQSNSPNDISTIQVDEDPTKRHFPQWPFAVDETYAAAPMKTLAAVTKRLNPDNGQAGREHWRTASVAWHEEAAKTVEEARAAGRLTPAVVSSALADVIDENTVLVDDAVTSRDSLLKQVPLTEPGSYVSKGGSGLGFATGAAVGVKLAAPNKRVVATVGDGAYLFGQPTVSAWLGVAYDAPTLTVVYDNRGWNAVAGATQLQHPDGAFVAADAPESRFGDILDLSVPAMAAGAVTKSVTELNELEPALDAGVEAVDNGKTVVVVVEVERPADL